MPRTVLEAASIGRPAIVSDVPGCRHAVINGITGWYCKVSSDSSLAESMKNVLNMEPYQIEIFGSKARKLVEEKFSEDIVISKYSECLKF